MVFVRIIANEAGYLSNLMELAKINLKNNLPTLILKLVIGSRHWREMRNQGESAITRFKIYNSIWSSVYKKAYR